MNQILHIKNDFKKIDRTIKNSKKKIFKTQFIISVILLFFIIIVYFFNMHAKVSKEFVSQQITSNYNITKLYNNENISESNLYNQNGQIFTVIGMIEIPKINIYYPIISEANDDLLKISPCRISGPMPNEDGNLCIAGHNYDNYKFFSKVSTLVADDKIIIHDLNGNYISYNVFQIYEVKANDLSPLNTTEGIKKQVTLITCNNFNSENRIIIKASSE